MNHPMFVAVAAVLFAGIALDRATAQGPQLAHMVYFKVKDEPADARQELVAACGKYLEGHEGTVYFSVGVLADEFKREVNDREFDVALHLVFANKNAHDAYLVHPRHVKFVKDYKPLWSKARVFDSYLEIVGD